MITIFASLLHERRIVVTSSRLARLTACVQALNSLLYPMCWQHIYIPLLPKHMKDYLSASIPFLIGVPLPILERVAQNEMDEAVILNADTGTVTTPFEDVSNLPYEVKDCLKKGLHSKIMSGDTLARAHLTAIVHLIGGYRDALKLRQGEKITFSDEAFLQTRPADLRYFLQQMLDLQIFRQFVNERLNLLNEGKSFSDEFEREVLKYAERSPTNAAHKLRNIRREGGALVKAAMANPAVKNAVKSVKEGSKNVTGKVQEVMRKSHTSIKSSHSQDSFSSQSAPASPKRTGGNDQNGLIRNTTDLNIKARVLKYEKFEPPEYQSSISPEFESPLMNMDLLAEMDDVMKTYQQPPAVDRQVSQLCGDTHLLYFEKCNRYS